MDLTYACVDNRGPNMQPIRDYNPGWMFFFIGFIVRPSLVSSSQSQHAYLFRVVWFHHLSGPIPVVLSVPCVYAIVR